MLRILTGLSLAVLLASGQAFADQATLDALQGQGIALSAEQAQAIAAAEGDALVAEVVALVGANQPVSPTIVRAAACASPNEAPDIIEQSIAAAPQLEDAINAAVSLGCEGIAGLKPGSGGLAPASGIPTGGGAGGGDASPN
ncbi:hypothetical protein [Pseudomonas sp. N040]|uniref:hypothetical protein n=1 Tax=Pseudomonas sp. N040 TaxID=2785325 RepID=UPI0018A2494A|nr:hypothetical protein [Pseudomonas sp. N040]MBF7730520.1 hypothetical protein [Pseudomonas sp. N040]MBW7014164.1 hypothetical protein [Pseudomonas sp. N040]